MAKIKGKTVLITGGASGIGFLMAKEFIKKMAAKIVIFDIDLSSLQASKQKFQNENTEIITFEVDLTNTSAMQKAIKKLSEEKVTIDILINNAGVVTGKKFADHTNSDIDKNMQLNAMAPMKLSLALLPEMIKSKNGFVVNIASAAGMLSNPGMSVYCASKWALTGWSDSLRLEMEQQKTGVRVLTVMPYYIDTGMFDGVQSPVIPILKPAKVVAKIIKAIENNRIILRMPKIIYILPFVKGILPKRIFDVVVGKYFGIYRSMDQFKGRNQ